MVVSIEFFGAQRAVTNVPGIKMPITEGATVSDAINYARRQYPALALDESAIVITVNREIAAVDTVLRANDTVSFLPFIGGG